MFSLKSKVRVKPSQDTPLLFHGMDGVVKSYDPTRKIYVVLMGDTELTIEEEFLTKA